LVVYLAAGGRFPASTDNTPHRGRLLGQPVAVLLQVHKREGRAQPLMILSDDPIARLDKSEDTLKCKTEVQPSI
jgi:hypothetical protein